GGDGEHAARVRTGDGEAAALVRGPGRVVALVGAALSGVVRTRVVRTVADRGRVLAPVVRGVVARTVRWVVARVARAVVVGVVGGVGGGVVCGFLGRVLRIAGQLTTVGVVVDFAATAGGHVLGEPLPVGGHPRAEGQVGLRCREGTELETVDRHLTGDLG